MKRRGVTVGLAALVVIVALVALELASGSGQSPTRPAPQLPTEVLNPPKVTLADLRGRPAVVNFFASWCGPCNDEAPEFESLSRSLKGGRAALVGVDWSDDLDNARAFIREHELTYPILRDSGKVGDEYGFTGLPATYVLDSRGRIVEPLRGPQPRADVEKALRSVEAGEEAEPAKSGRLAPGKQASA